MRFHGPQRRLELALFDKPDADGWIGVHVVIDGPDGSWSASSRCLRVNDVARLIAWFQSAAADPGREGRLDTLDGELSFELSARLLRVHFGWRLRPPRAQSESVGEFFREYPVTGPSLEKAAETLREQLLQITRESTD